VPISHHDRVYSAEQFSNTVSVIDPVDNKTLGVIRLGDPSPGNLSPLYRGQVLVHGMGFSPDHRTLDVVSIGENYVDVLDGTTYQEKTRITVPAGPGMQIFSPDGKYGYVCSSFNPETDVITVADHKIVARIPQESPFCPNIAATPDGKQVWFTLKDIGKVEAFNARPPFNVLKSIERSDHEPRQHRSERPRPVRVCDHRWAQRGQGVSYRHVRPGCDHPGRQAPARDLAVGRR
jgi:YVTN family beta-propeller protein